MPEATGEMSTNSFPGCSLRENQRGSYRLSNAVKLSKTTIPTSAARSTELGKSQPCAGMLST